MNIQLPKHLVEWEKTSGFKVTDIEKLFILMVHDFRKAGVGYGFMQGAIEGIWNEDPSMPGGGWGPRYFEARIRELEKQLKEK